MSGFIAKLAAWFRSLIATPKKVAAIIAAAAAFVGPWEGQRIGAYLDRIASPPVWDRLLWRDTGRGGAGRRLHPGAMSGDAG